MKKTEIEIGDLYSSAFQLTLWDNKFRKSKILEADTPFVVLELDILETRHETGRIIKILTLDGEIHWLDVWYAYLQKVNQDQYLLEFQKTP